MTIQPVDSPRQLGRFIEFPYRFYRDRKDPYWVPPLRSDERARLTPGKNPFFEHAEAALFLAEEGGRVTGRIAASVDRNYDSLHGERQAAFGFFEAESAPAAAALLASARSWAREKDADVLRGPLSFTTNDECGLLIEGFDHRPALMMPYNPPEYAEWIEAAGFQKAKDLYSFRAPIPSEPPPAYARIAAMTRRKENVRTRAIDMRRFREELERVKELYNNAWEKNWGFVPMTEREIDHMAAQLKPAIVPDLVRFAEVDGVPVAFGLLMPDLNIALRKAGGRLFPFGLFQILWTMPRIREFRFMALGIRAEWRRTGIAPLLVDELCRVVWRKGYRSCEIGWTLEDNEPVNRLAIVMGGTRSGVYRIYEREVA
ncbi:MAG TPA: N-acetyltransferase [Candidatus Eisenbacteria bacterium]|nr:N-acetyltransferase [Candidatus Eisenbacteria bacterium]